MLNQDKTELLSLLSELEYRKRYNKIKFYLPDEGKFRRELYQKHVGFFNAGKDYPQRIFMAGNRTGKTQAGAAEMTYHLTGLYPDWWQGKRFSKGVFAWAASYTGFKTRDTCQKELVGEYNDPGSGFIPKDLIVDFKSKPGIPNGLSCITVKHVSGDISYLEFKSYDQGQEGFVGTAPHAIWLDEECPYSIFSECLIRTMTTDGIVYITFTPDKGLSETVLSFYEDGVHYEGGKGFKHSTTVAWDDCPHLDEKAKEMLRQTIPPWQLSAKSKGIPVVGTGAIYPISEDSLIVEPFKIPDYWPRAYGLDTGWQCTAAVWGAWDKDSDTVYLYSEYKVGNEKPPIHAAAIKGRGEWMRGAGDAAATNSDGKQYIQQYRDLGLNLVLPDKSVEAGLFAVYNRMSSGRFKIFSTLNNWLTEFRLYRRDDNGKIVKKNDHLMDATRYLIMTGLKVAETEPNQIEQQTFNGFYGKSLIGGY